MTAPEPEILVKQLQELTDRQRLDFAIWSVDLADFVSTAGVAWGQPFLDHAEVERAAVLAFTSLRHDRSVPDATGSVFFDPAIGQGIQAWMQAITVVRAMVDASVDPNTPPTEGMARAFRWVAAPPEGTTQAIVESAPVAEGAP